LLDNILREQLHKINKDKIKIGLQKTSDFTDANIEK
jgi:hypothetical protein